MNRYDTDRKATVTVDRSTLTGRVKPLNGVNNAPYYYGDPRHMHYLKEANVPFSRLHDTCGPYGGNRYVDIDNIFRDPGADENDPSNYDFVATDHLLNSLCENGVKIIYRLGCTIENDPFGIGYRIFPPKDYGKWARICEHIILHYNEGWANGFRLGISYWEIWNEPDNMPAIDENPMWRGTAEQFFELYRTAACHLKSRFPELKIGGYGSCGFYSVVQKEVSPEAHVSERTAYFTDFFEGFLKYISSPATKAPLDFFSWHSYADECSCVRFAVYARKKLDQYGFTQTESIFDEWNAGTSLRGTLEDASRVASMMITMNSAPVDVMAYYDAQYNHSYGGLFSSEGAKPLSAYYAFKAFGELYADGETVKAETDDPALKILSTGKRLLIVNAASSPVYVSVKTESHDGGGASGLRIIDSGHDLSEINWDNRCFPLSPFAIALISF